MAAAGTQAINVNQEILAMEEQTWEALKQGGEQLLPYLAADCIMIFPGSAIFDARSNPPLEEILTRPDLKPWTQYDMEDVRVVALGMDAAMICYEVRARRADEPSYTALISSVWRRAVGGGWQMCLHQQTPVDVLPS